jgi:hypothetical protein
VIGIRRFGNDEGGRLTWLANSMSVDGGLITKSEEVLILWINAGWGVDKISDLL